MYLLKWRESNLEQTLQCPKATNKWNEKKLIAIATADTHPAALYLHNHNIFIILIELLLSSHKSLPQSSNQTPKNPLTKINKTCLRKQFGLRDLREILSKILRSLPKRRFFEQTLHVGSASASADRRLVGRRDFLHNPVEKGINISTIRIVGFTSEISRFSSERSRLYTKMAVWKKNKHVFFCFHVWLMRWIGEMYIVMKYPEFHCNIFYTCLYVLVEWISGSHHETFMTSDWHTFKHLHWLATWPNHDPDKSTNPKSRPNLSTHNLDSIWIHQSIISRKFHDIRTRTSRGRKFPVYKKNINL